MPYGGNVLAVGGFSRFLAVTTSAEAVKLNYGGNFWMVMPYGGSFSAVGGFPFLAVTTLAEAVKPKYGSNGKTKTWR